MERDGFKSRLGFILVSAGCAIGIGNVWKFPYVAGKSGGGIFVLFYFLFLALIGEPILVMELSIGRAGRQGIIQAYKKLEPKKSKWHIHGWICLFGCFLLMMYYTTVSGWMLDYCWKFLSGGFVGVTNKTAESVFNNMLKNPAEMLIFMSIIVVLGFVVCSGGIKNGLEKVSKFMMLALLGLIVVLVINSLMLKGAGKGLEFFLSPDIERASQAGWANVITSAMTQAFFTLSIGIASMEIFGSYMSKDNTLPSESIRITALDTFVAVMSGLIIFPACFSFDVEPSQGPALIFMTLPKIFINMPFGRVWGTLFFLFMSFASFSTVTAVFESLISASIENFGLSRKKAVVINCVIMLAASLPCLLGFNVLSFVQLAGKNILDMEDFIVSNILLPVGAFVFVAFCTLKYGWGFDKFLGESNTGKGLKFSPVLKNYFKFALPVMIILVLVSGFVG